MSPFIFLLGSQVLGSLLKTCGKFRRGCVEKAQFEMGFGEWVEFGWLSRKLDDIPDSPLVI